MEEKRIKRQPVFDGKLIKVYQDTVLLPNGKEANREVVEHPGAVAVLAIDEQGQIIIVKQYRYPMAQISLEIPAGKLEENEDPLECAKRELTEETGYIANAWKKIMTPYTSPGFANEVIHIYLAQQLEQIGASPDEDEFVECIHITLEDALHMIDTQEIRDAKTITALLWWSTQNSHFQTEMNILAESMER
ncbi:NUDIX domain-containing protein [Desulfuribacillus stibiiarsenatis]|nr:NUDIX hydrolase [Desulfuribacillus stibiiarsenatis]